ncbi:hypothetical protein CGK63_09940, partial [Vibrio parahaemolyticus]
RFDCGSVEGYIEATNYCYENLYKKDSSAELAKKPTGKLPSQRRSKLSIRYSDGTTQTKRDA